MSELENRTNWTLSGFFQVLLKELSHAFAFATFVLNRKINKLFWFGYADIKFVYHEQNCQEKSDNTFIICHINNQFVINTFESNHLVKVYVNRLTQIKIWKCKKHKVPYVNNIVANLWLEKAMNFHNTEEVENNIDDI